MSPKVKSRLALVGGLLGLVATVGIAVVLAINTSREPIMDRWRLVMPVTLAAPYVVALGSAFVARASVRAMALLAASLSSFVFMALLFTLGPTLLPATIVLVIAAFRALRDARLSLIAGAARSIAAIAGAVLFVGAFFALISSHDESCWETIRYPDGREEHRPADRFQGGSIGPFPPPGQTGADTGTPVGGGCASDVVTVREAVLSLGLTLGGIAFLVLVANLGLRTGARAGATPA